MRAQIHTDQTFSKNLAALKGAFLDAYDHQDYTFGRLVRQLKLSRDASRVPLVEVTFNIDQTGEQHDFAGLEVQVRGVPRRFINFDLEFDFNQTAHALVLECRYNTDLFAAETIERWLGYYQTLLAAIVADAARPVANLPLLSDAEQHTILVQWNQTAANYPRTQCMHELIQQQAARTPEAVAVAFESTTLTYRQLEQRASQLAHYLRTLSVGPGMRVGMCLERSLDMVVSLLGILKAGAAYVPMDPASPQQRLAYMLEDAQIGVLVTQQRLRETLSMRVAQAVCVDRDCLLIAEQPQEHLHSDVDATHLAYVIYTSGSTGLPKGVQIPHRALTNLLCSMQRQPGMTAQDVLASVTTLSFDIAGLELYLLLITGARVVVLSRDVAADGVQLAAALEHYGVTVMQATPGTWHLLLESGWQGRHNLKMLCGGEALSARLAQQLLKRGGELWNVYGPTETTVWSTVDRVQPPPEVIAIGRPIANTQLYLLDANLQPVPRGVTGTLYIGGAGLACGYLNRPELATEKFIPHPFSADAYARLYNTGDLARYLPDGRVECLGRTDSQVKIRGFRIELGEIEAVLLQHPAVQEAVVLARVDATGDKCLVAYIVAPTPHPPNLNELRCFLKTQLPDYMVPGVFDMLEALPRTPAGKIDRLALPTMVGEQPALDASCVPPQTPMEQEVARLWTEILGLDRLGIHDNFFDIGGHSLRATQVITRLSQLFQVDLPLRLIFEAPTVASLAVAIMHLLAEQNDATEVLQIIRGITTTARGDSPAL